MVTHRIIRQFRRMSAGEVVAVVVVALTGLAALVEWVRWLGSVG